VRDNVQGKCGLLLLLRVALTVTIQSNHSCESLDLIDWLLEHVINENRTRRSIIKKLKEMCLMVNSKVSCTLDPSDPGIPVWLIPRKSVNEVVRKKKIPQRFPSSRQRGEKGTPVHPLQPFLLLDDSRCALLLTRSMIYEDLGGKGRGMGRSFRLENKFLDCLR